MRSMENAKRTTVTTAVRPTDTTPATSAVEPLSNRDGEGGRVHLERMLGEALEDSYPASDPLSSLRFD